METKRPITILSAVLAAGVLLAGTAKAADEKTNQVFFRSGISYLTQHRGGEVFTDTLGPTFGPQNDGQGGFNVAAGLDLTLAKRDDLKGNTLLGEILVEYSRFSNQRVVTTTSGLLFLDGAIPAASAARVPVSELNVTVAPKLRFDSLGPVRPFIIPIGMSFLVNSPPSNNTTYLDMGVHFGGGVDIKVADQISVGADIRYTHGFEASNTHDRFITSGAYLGINF